MGANSSSLSDLSSNEYLRKLAGSDPIIPSDPFWNQLLSFKFHVPRNSADQRLLEESVALLCKNFAIDNCRTGNFGSLIRVFILRAREIKSTPEVEDNIFLWQTYNAVFIVRNMCKYFVESLSEEVILQQFNTQPQTEEGGSGGMGSDITDPLMEELINSLIEVLVDIPVVDYTYGLHMEALNTILILLSIQMFQPSPANDSAIFAYLMTGKSSIHACVLMKTLIQNYINQEKCPAEMLESAQAGGGLVAAVASGLWSVMTLGMGSASDSPPEEIVSDKLLANQSLLLILILANHCTSERGLHNPYREALFSFTNSQDLAQNTNPTQSAATFKVDLSALYATLGCTLREDQTTLLLYLLLHQNSAVKSFILTRTNLDALVMPILRILYHAPEENSHHIYMALIVLLVLSEDEYFSTAVHEITIKHVPWFKERPISEITLGGMLVLVVIRTIQYNMTRMRDKYLHTNCLAALANMSAHFKYLHPYVAQRIVSLFGLLQKKHTRLVDQIACKNHTLVNNGSESGSDIEPEDYVQDLAVLEEVIRMVLEIINSCLCHTLQHNVNLVYTLLYQKHLFSHFATHPTFQDIIQNIDTVLGFFTSQLEKGDKNVSVPQVMEIIQQGAVTFKKDRLKKFPELKFKYVEEDQPEEFFIPYVWSLVYHASGLYFNPSRIQLFSLHHGAEDDAS